MKITRKIFSKIYKLTKWSWNDTSLAIGMSRLSIPILVLSLLLAELTKSFFQFNENIIMAMWFIILTIFSSFIINTSILINNTFKLEEDLKNLKIDVLK